MKIPSSPKSSRISPIVLQLRAVSGPILGDAELVYPPDHPQYAEVMKHLGGIAPGQEKAVAPWPE